MICRYVYNLTNGTDKLMKVEVDEVDPLNADEGLSEVRQLAAEQFERAALLELGLSNAPAHRTHLVAWHRLPDPITVPVHGAGEAIKMCLTPPKTVKQNRTSTYQYQTQLPKAWPEMLQTLVDSCNERMMKHDQFFSTHSMLRPATVLHAACLEQPSRHRLQRF